MDVDVETYLNHWSVFQKIIHRFCQKSKKINTLVAAIEMRMGREELLSLPQYMGLCPTGICNASCLFCSVTRNRTGIEKKELPYDKLARFLDPVYRTIRTFGLEGNGEPTLYSRFNDLVKILTHDGASFYLITNGEHLTADQIDFLLSAGISSVNFSINAASPETHFQVMRLKRFEHIIENIKRFNACREKNNTPDITISFVVNCLNVHEVVDFLDMGLGLLRNTNDRIYIRPLSELANDSGNIEDTRGIVPFESDIRDMIEGVEEYLHSHSTDVGVFFEPDSFKSFRPDPPDKIVAPLGYERQILPPRKKDWRVLCGDVEWSLAGFSVSARNLSDDKMIMESCPIPVEPHGSLQFFVYSKVSSGEGLLSVLTETGDKLASLFVSADQKPEWHELFIETTDNDVIYLNLRAVDENLNADFEFKRFRTPAGRILKGFIVPESHRWQVDSPGVVVEWSGKELSLQWQGPENVYLVKSYMIPCRSEDEINVPVKVTISSGILGIGILSEDGRSWVSQFLFKRGETETALVFNSNGNHGLQLVLFSMEEGLLKAKINWSPENNAKSEIVHKSVAEIKMASADIKKKHTGNASNRQKLEDKDKAAKQPIKYYCQKPWTDLNNFTVDGRMDVCCIATGPSQERYALGNIYDDDFQKIWNGERMREFRRTVNSNKKLPPCRRCPMAYAYQGPFFSPRVNHPFNHPVCKRLFKIVGIETIHSKISSFIDYVIYQIFFQGFKR